MLAQAVAPFQFDRTIHFVFFTAEELGMLGSYEYVEQGTLANQKTSAAIILDMIAYAPTLSMFGSILEGPTSGTFESFFTVATLNFQHVTPSLRLRNNTNYFGSDHVPFLK